MLLEGRKSEIRHDGDCICHPTYRDSDLCEVKCAKSELPK